jgi:Uma2 family endonuclease
MALQKPESHAWTWEDLVALPDDGKRYEIIMGELHEMPGPGMVHVQVVANLVELVVSLVRQFGLRLYTAPADLFIRDGNPVQPDLLAIRPNGSCARTARGFEGPPELVIEVVSPSNREHDDLTKRALYGLGGVGEYWVVDPERQTVEVTHLHADALHSAGVFRPGETIVSPLLPGAELPVDAVFADLDAIQS